MADFFKGLQGGFTTGLEFGKQLRRRRMEDELGALGGEADPVEGQQLKVGSDVGLVANGAMGTDADGNAIDPVRAYKEAYARAGMDAPEVGFGGTGYAARSGSYDQGVYGSTDEAQRASDRYNYGLMRKQADVYRRYGEDDMARALSRDARAGERDDARFGLEQKRFDMAQAQHEQSMKLGAIQLNEAERKQADTEMVRTVYKQIQAYSEANGGREPTFAEAQDIARKAGATPDQILSMGATLNGIKENEAKAFAQHVQQAVRGKGYAELIALHKTDPMFDDKRHFVERRGPKGELILDLVDETTGKVVGSQAFANEAEATDYLHTAAVEPKNLLNWMMTLQSTKLGLEKTEAEINESIAKSRYYDRMPKDSGSGGGAGGGAGGGLKLSDVPHIQRISAQAAQMWAKNLDGGSGKFAAGDGTYRTQPQLDELTYNIAMDLVAHGKIPTPDAIVAIMRAGATGARPSSPGKSTPDATPTAGAKAKPARPVTGSPEAAKASNEARIAELRKIIAAPTYDWSKGLLGSQKGAVLESVQEKARAELERRLRTGQ